MMNPEYLSECYIRAYNKAFELTKNPNLAVGAGMAVINTIANQSKVQNQNPSMNLFMAALMNGCMKKSQEQEEGDPNETD